MKKSTGVGPVKIGLNVSERVKEGRDEGIDSGVPVSNGTG